MKKVFALLIACLYSVTLLANHWTPMGANYSDVMAMYTVIQINGVEQFSDQLEVGVFCGDECRGSSIASEFPVTHRYLAVLTVYGQSGHQLTFKLYDHGTGQEYATSQEAITFNEDGYGNPIQPYTLDFIDGATGNNIDFADANVKALCVANWDTNGDGELSYDEAASVTNLGTVFRNNRAITSFDELQYFTGVAIIVKEAFRGCINLTSVAIPSSVIGIKNYAFAKCSGLQSLNVLAETPPMLGSGVFGNVNRTIPVYVPCGSLAAYQSSTGWSWFINIQDGCTQTQAIALTEGWNWVSFYVEITLDELKATLVEAAPGTPIAIKSISQTVTYNPNNGRWSGNLTQLDFSQMYRIMVSTNCEMELQGALIDPAEHPVTISNGTNWIAFPLSESMSVAEAFAGFAVNGDQIKSMSQSAQYRSNRWRGQLTTLEPGVGYIYVSNAQGDRVFTFPASAK